MKKYAAISFNFDSLGEAYGFPTGYHDPSFFVIADRFFDISNQYHFKYSIYVIGKDLEKEDNRAQVKQWAQSGHEIGNHSWAHHMDLAALSREEISTDIKQAHDIIMQTTGKAPTGFISPAWGSSPALYSVLNELNYRYDTSAFPSWVMIPAMLKNALNYIGNQKMYRIFYRKDFSSFLWGRRQTYKEGNVTVLPLPTNRYRVACWHTLGFVIGWERHLRLLRSCLRDVDAFYYLIHPADLLDTGDLDPTKQLPFQPRGPSLEERQKRLKEAVEVILESGRQIVTMQELAGQI